MSTQVPAEPRKSPPPWLVPVGIGMIVALLVALIIVILTRDESSDGSDTTAPVSTAATGETAIETVPETTAAATETTPAETVPGTTVPATEPATTVPAVITAGQANVVAEGSTQTFGVAATCSDFWAGAQTTSHLLVSANHHVWVVDVLSFEEGGDRLMQAVDMDFTIAANVFGQDVGVSPTYSGNIDDNSQTAGLTTAALKLTSGDGPASIEVTLGDTAVDDCAVGTFTPQSPFALGTQVEWQSPDDTNGQRFNVMADCGGNLIVSAGGLLLTDYPQDGSTMAAGLVNTHNLTGSDVWWTNLISPTAEESAFEQGGGGDISAAINAYPDGDRTAPPGYLSWTERPPRSAVGAAGLRDDVCTQSP